MIYHQALIRRNKPDLVVQARDARRLRLEDCKFRGHYRERPRPSKVMGQDLEKKCKRAEDINTWLDGKALVSICEISYWNQNTEEVGEGREENNLNPNWIIDGEKYWKSGWKLMKWWLEKKKELKNPKPKVLQLKSEIFPHRYMCLNTRSHPADTIWERCGILNTWCLDSKRKPWEWSRESQPIRYISGSLFSDLPGYEGATSCSFHQRPSYFATKLFP